MLKRNLFTLVELLVVVGIIAVLAGMILPAVVGAQQQGRITQAKSDMSAISMALKGMENAYGRMVTKKDDKFKFDGHSAAELKDGSTVLGIKLGKEGADGSNDGAYDSFIAELTVPAQKSSGNFVIKAEDLNTNKRRLTFLDPQSGYDPNQKYDAGTNPRSLWRDPWGSQYCIMIRTSSSEYMNDPSVSGKKLAGNVAIYSFGPNAIDEDGKSADRTGDQGKDDIISWE